MQSPLGPLLLAATEHGLCGIYFQGKRPDTENPHTRKNEVWIESEEALRPYRLELEAYFRGDLKEFTCSLDLRGTEFQKRCWEALRKIPYGTICSYGDIARIVGSPKASRAVGQANHNNPVPIIVPCHRVIGSNGTLTGYGGGLSVKEKLLQLEGVAPQTPLLFPSLENQG
jgi:O-6-methylguanine DNA methyltransferase